MKIWIYCFFLFFTALCSGESFTDLESGISLEIPPGFSLKEESVENSDGCSRSYEFYDINENMIAIEIEKYNHTKSLPEYFHHTMTFNGNDEEEGNDRLIYKGLEFKNLKIGDIEFTKFQLRVLALSDQYFEPLYICDYLFVKDHFGFTISLYKQDVPEEDSEPMMNALLKSIRFENKLAPKEAILTK